jgi:hypothetical protein
MNFNFYGEPPHGLWCNTQIKPTRCKDCLAKVFYFSCDHGSKVLFDQLGEPWPKHQCTGYVLDSYQGPFIASERRTKFHRPDCTWATYLHELNSVEFATRGEAVEAGYKSCNTCCA